jgi:hypothetical protein
LPQARARASAQAGGEEHRIIGTPHTTPGAAPGLRHRRLWTVFGIGFVLLVIYLSLARPPRDLDLPDVFDVGHVIAYCWLMLWFAQLHRAASRRWLFAAGFGAMGIVLEYIQGTTGYRHFDYADMLRNFIGVALGFGLACTPLQDTLYWVERRLAPGRA